MHGSAQRSVRNGFRVLVVAVVLVVVTLIVVVGVGVEVVLVVVGVVVVVGGEVWVVVVVVAGVVWLFLVVFEVYRVPAGRTNDTFSPGLACSFRKEVNACVENHCVHSDIQSFVSSNCSIPLSSSKQSFMTKDTPCEIQCKKSIHGQSAWIISFVDCQSAPPSKATANTFSGPMRSIIFLT